MNNKDITILILLYKTPFKLLKNLKTYKSFKILILDQSNDLSAKKFLKKILPNIQYYGTSKKNHGFAYGQNFLIKKVKTNFFFSTQPDITLSVKSILNLKKTIIKFKKDCVISVPKIFGLKNSKIVKKNNTKKEYAIKNMIGAAFMAEKKKFIKLGMFDENFFFYWEDVDLSHRVNKSKYNIFLNCSSLAKHISGTSSENTIKTLAIRNINFKFGEYFFLSKVKKLRLLKVVRQLILNLIYSFFHLLLLKFKESFKYICYFLGIIKFFIVKFKLYAE